MRATTLQFTAISAIIFIHMHLLFCIHISGWVKLIKEAYGISKSGLDYDRDSVGRLS